MVGEHRAFLRREAPEREPGDALGVAVAETHRESELQRELEKDVEEVGPLLQRREVTVDVAGVEAPHDRPLDLRAALAPDLVEVGVFPGVLDRPREPTVTVEQARRVGDRAPPVRLALRIQRELHADVLTAVAGRGITRPRARHHQ